MPTHGPSNRTNVDLDRYKAVNLDTVLAWQGNLNEGRPTELLELLFGGDAGLLADDAVVSLTLVVGHATLPPGKRIHQAALDLFDQIANQNGYDVKRLPIERLPTDRHPDDNGYYRGAGERRNMWVGIWRVKKRTVQGAGGGGGSSIEEAGPPSQPPPPGQRGGGGGGDREGGGTEGGAHGISV
jgi:hypothetical protein